MKAIVLAAGRSKRMQPVGDKNFLDFLGKPLIVRQVEMLKEAGFDDVVVVGGAHNLAGLREVLDGVEFAEQEDLDGGMRAAVMACKGVEGPALIFSSNDVVDGSAFEAVMAAAQSGDAGAYILGKKVEEYFPGGYLEVVDGEIRGIVEKPGAGNEPSDMVNLVVHLHQDFGRLVEYLEKADSERDDVYEVALDTMIKDGVKMLAVPYDGFWQPIKFPWHVQKVFRYFFDKAEKVVHDTAQISEHAVVKGDVVISEGVKVLEGAVVRGPAYLGPGVVVANNALVRDSHVGARSVIGFSTEVARSYLGADVWTHSNYVGDSVIGNNVSFGAGTVTGNLRLDSSNVVVDCNGQKVDCGSGKFGLICGNDVRAGINVSFMPGVKIGGDSFIGAGIVVAENIPEKSFVRGSFELKISENRKSAKAEDRGELKKKL